MVALSPMTIFSSNAWLVVAATCFGVAALNGRGFLVLAALVAGLLLGTWRGAGERLHLMEYQAYYGHIITLRGRIAEDASLGAGGLQQVKLNNVAIQDKNLHGQVWTSMTSAADVKRGDIITLKGRLGKGFGNLPAALPRARLLSIAHPQPGDIARRIRDWFNDRVRQVIPDPQASLGIGFLTGQRNALPQTLDEQLRLLGLTHIVVASGYNLTVLVSVARRMLAGVSKYLAAFSASTMIASFVMITGLSPSMSRAGLVAGLSLAAWYYGRVIHPLILLPFAAAITVLVNPAYLWGDIGWMLSFASFVGVIVLAPLVQHYFWGSQKPGVFRQILIDTMSAQIVTLPIIAYAFGTYSPLALPANLLILPLIPLTMLLTFVAGIGSICLSGATWIGVPAEWILRYMTTVIDWLGNLPWAQGELAFGVRQIVLSYALLILLLLFLRHQTRHNFRKND
jgi:competence protein ComEC